MVSYGGGTTFTGTSITLTGAAAGSVVLTDQVTGDAQPRLSVDAAGVLRWSDGTNAADLDLYRKSAGLLQTDYAFATTGNLTAGGKLIASGGQGLNLLTGGVPATPAGSSVTLYSQGGALYVIDAAGAVLPVGSLLHTGMTSFSALAESINHNAVSQTVIQPVSGELQLMSIGLQAGQVVTSIGFCTGVTAAITPTHWWAAVVDKNYLLAAHTADQLTAALPASTWQKLNLTAPYTATYTGLYYLALMVASSGTQPSVISATVQSQFVSGTNAPTPGVGGRSTTGLTAPGTDGVTTYATPTAIGGYYYAYAI